MVGTMSVLDKTGDSKIKWNTDDVDEVDAARKHFNSLKRRGYVAYKGRGKRGSVIKEFDPDAGEITMCPQSVGG